MGMVKDLNDILWGNLFNLLQPLTDNVYGVILIVTLFFAVVFNVIGRIAKTYLRIPFFTFGILSILLICSIGYMTQRLPVIHPRMHRSLATTADILEMSPAYIEDFEKNARIKVSDTLDIVSYLYQMDEKDRETWDVEPKKLYSTFFSVSDQIRSFLILPDVNRHCFSFRNMILIVFSLFIIGCSIPLKQENIRWAEILIFLFQCGFVIGTLSVSAGTSFAAVSLWFMEISIHKAFENGTRFRFSFKNDEDL